jgi:hypothetical protein
MREAMLIGLVLPLLGACSSAVGDDSSTSKEPRQAPAEDRLPLQQRIVQAWPNAVCHYAGAADGVKLRDLRADDQGVVRLSYARSADATGEVLLDCAQENGRHELFATQPAPPIVPVEQRVMRPGHTLRPALSAEEMALLTAEQLEGRGYPPRPDAQSASQYAQWVKSVSSSMELIRVRDALPVKSAGSQVSSPVARPTRASNIARSHVGTSSRRAPDVAGPGGATLADAWRNPVWSGMFLDNPETYNIAAGSFITPTVVGPTGPCWDYCYLGEASIWVGIGGADGQHAILQSGVLFSASKAFVGGASIIDVLTRVWWEYYRFSFGGGATFLDVSSPHMEANPGDSVYVVVSTDIANGQGSIHFENQTTNHAVYISTWIDGYFTGDSAEWIIERYGSEDVPDYGTATINNISAHTNYGYWDNLSTDPGHTGQAFLVNESDSILSTAQANSATSAGFTWWQTN